MKNAISYIRRIFSVGILWKLSIPMLSLILGTPMGGYAIQPVSLSQDLVAGQGAPGYRDGPFYSALFKHPQGLAIDPLGKNLYVADRENNRIRVVRLDRSNQVETLAGTGAPGSKDGLCGDATFRGPSILVFLPGERLLVFDSGNRVFRLLDLKLKTVSTLTIREKVDPKDTGLSHTGLEDVWNAIYLSKGNAVYFSQPDRGVIRKLDLSQWEMSTVFEETSELARPAALCTFHEDICVSDKGKGGVYLLALEDRTKGSLSIRKKISVVDRIVALAVSDDGLYALRSDRRAPWMRFSPLGPGEAVTISLRSVWGERIQPTKSSNLPPLLDLEQSEPAGFVPDPRLTRVFFVSSNYLSGVMSIKDRSQDILVRGDSANRDAMPEFEYPAAKPPDTFRILIVGSSYPHYQTRADNRRWGWVGNGGDGNRLESMPKRLELLLNADAALGNVPIHFEVINGSQSGQAGYLPLRYRALDLIKKYDIDLVLYVMTSSVSDVSRSCILYFQRPLTEEGIPQAEQNVEYLLTPWENKIHDGVSRQFYEYALRKKTVRTHAGHSQVSFVSFPAMISDQEGRGLILEMLQKPVAVFKKNLDRINAIKAKKTGFLICFVPVRDGGLGGMRRMDSEILRGIWRNLAESVGTPFLDLLPPFVALSETFWPIDEPDYGQHFSANGHFLFAYILERELVAGKIVPFSPLEK